jgi:predicted DCC family thiol-disulfide oxidoreductase YuxK
MARSEAALLVYDGDCAFCQRCVDVAARILPDPFRAEPYQFLPLATLGLSVEQASTQVWWVQPSRPACGGHAAVARLLQGQRRWWWRSAGWILERPPVAPLAAWVYAAVARNRHRLPGGTARCRVPAAAGQGAATQASSG